MTTVKNTVKGYVEQWLVEGKNHAFIIMGQEEEAYEAHVHDFIDRCENKDTQINLPQVSEENNTDTEKGTQSFLEKLINALKK